MADYPGYEIAADGYGIKPDEGLRASRASDGTLRRRRLYPQTIYTVTIKHPMLTAAEMASLEAFYATNRDIKVNWADPLTGRLYLATMMGPPEHTGVQGATYLDVQMILEGVRV